MSKELIEKLEALKPQAGFSDYDSGVVDCIAIIQNHQPSGDVVERELLGDIARELHYPECWDTVAYPSIFNALLEIAACNECKPIAAIQHTNQPVSIDSPDKKIQSDVVERVARAVELSIAQCFGVAVPIEIAKAAIAAMQTPAHVADTDVGEMVDIPHICNQIDEFLKTSDDEMGSNSRALLAAVTKALRETKPHPDVQPAQVDETIGGTENDIQEIIRDLCWARMDKNGSPYIDNIPQTAQAVIVYMKRFYLSTKPHPDVRDALEDLEIMFRQLEERHDKTGYVENRDYVGIDGNLDNVRASIKHLKASLQGDV